ncbi:guanine deaminase [Granulosicoccus antarcticus]|nr:guanine deaminase [Granulosicoccus antarcticus]
MTSQHAQSDSWHLGLFMHMPRMSRLEVLENTLIQVDALGSIVSLTRPDEPEYTERLHTARRSGALTEMSSQQMMIPGLVDLHVHAPQWPQLGKALHLPLQDWLNHYTFPLEARYQDIDFARQVYPSLVRALLANGTTTAMYFATVHEEATELLAATCLALGQRAYVGRVAMDDPQQCPDYYRDSDAQAAVAASERSIHAIRQLSGNQNQLVKPVITPRFIPSCTNDLLAGLGELAARHQCHVQTHCSESDWEHDYVLNRLGKTDTQALADFGLLNRHTVLAHSNFITDSDMGRIQEAGSGIAHCPLSNSYFADSVFPLRRALDKSLRVGLGTDIAGGHSASLFNTCQHAVASSRMLESGVDARLPAAERGQANARINFLEAFYLATAGGADVLDSPTGLFEPGRQFDALLLDLDCPENRLNEFTRANDWEDLLGCVVYNTQPCNIGRVWIDGRCVHG